MAMAVSNLRNMISVLREMSFDDIRDDATRTPRFAVYAPSVTDARWFAAELLGPEAAGGHVSPREMTESVADLQPYDAVIVFDPEGQAESGGLNNRLRVLDVAPPVFRLGGFGSREIARIEELRADIVRRMADRSVAIGRAFPALRAAASKAVIDETAMANAQFALVSNIPSLLPVIGGIAAAGADFLVLTKNQIMMIYKLAAIHGRNLDDQIGILQEIVPVVGLGFVWRTAARGAATIMPFASGTIPKIAIAYAASNVTGRAAEYYYRTNRRPTNQQFEQFFKQVQDRLRTAPEQLRSLIAARRAPNHEPGANGGSDPAS